MSVRIAIVSVLLWSVGAIISVNAQARREFVGPGKCVDCHDHKDEKEWSEKRDGDGKGKQHKNALNRLADPKADEYAKVLRVDVYDVKSTCVKCHATVVRGNADDGISCESCHGAGKDYLKPHQEKGAYQASLALGLKDVLKKPENWVRECVTCHVLGDNPGDTELVKAGHSSGADFELRIKFQPVSSHWTTKYTGNAIAAIGDPVRNTLLARLKPSKPAVPVAVPAAPAPVASAAPAAALSLTLPTQPASPPPVRGAAPAPPVASAPAAAGNSASVATTRDAASSGSRATAPIVAPPSVRLAMTPPPLPSPPAIPAAPVITTTVDAPASATPASLVGALQGRVAQLLSDLLTRGVRTPVKLTAPATSTPYRGPDAELLRLQEEVIALALEALGTAPAPKPARPPQ